MHSNPRPHGLLRLFLRFPILLYRLGLGWLFGDRLALLTHIGRNSGRQRQVVIETVRMDRATNTLYILSGWGEQSDWVLNILNTPEVVIQLGLRRWPATAVRLAAAQAEQELLGLTRADGPRRWPPWRSAIRRPFHRGVRYQKHAGFWPAEFLSSLFSLAQGNIGDDPWRFSETVF